MTPHDRFTAIRAALAELEGAAGRAELSRGLEQVILEHLKVLERDGILELLEPWTAQRPEPMPRGPRG